MPGKKGIRRLAAGVVFWLLLVILASPLSGPKSFVVASSANVPTGIVIPLYSYPGTTWTEIVNTKMLYPGIPFTVVINPSNGPGNTFSSTFLTGTQQLQEAGITVLGYVNTHYGRTSLAKVESQINSYWKWYHANGIMFDEMSYVNGKQGYYSTLDSYVDSLGISVTIGNPGTSTLASYVGTLNTLDIYENPGLPSVSSIQSATFDGAYGNSNFALISLSVPLPSQTYLQSVSGCVAWVYFTDAGPRTAYSRLPSYFTTEVAKLSTLAPATSCV